MTQPNLQIPRLGVCYYPEHWPESVWSNDATRMFDMGIRTVRVGEFAWSRLEAEPGNLSFDWLHRAIDTLHKAGLNVVLGTPTATPPRWMLARHPDRTATSARALLPYWPKRLVTTQLLSVGKPTMNTVATTRFRVTPAPLCQVFNNGVASNTHLSMH